MPPLKNPKHERFALLCFERPEATTTQNYIDAGYIGCSKDSARKNSTTLRHSKTLQDRIQELQDAVAADTIMTVQEIEERLSEIGRARITDFVSCGVDGTWINVGLGDCKSAAIKEIQSTTVYKKGREGDQDMHAGIVTDLKLHDPLKAYDMLLKRKGAYPATKMEHTGEGGKPLAFIVEVVDDTTKQLVDEILNGQGTEEECQT